MTTSTALSPALRRLIESIEDARSFTPLVAQELLEAASVTPDDLAAWADYDHPAADSYGRKMIWDGGWFELMAMSWVDGDMAAIHDHGSTQWGAVQLFGPAEHAVFAAREGVVTTGERCRFASGDVVPVSHDLVHQMGNVGSEPFLSLHLYGCEGLSGDVTAGARLFELDEGVIQRVSGGVFFALPETEVDEREPGVRGDFPTTLRYKVELLKRLLQMHSTLDTGEPASPREVRLIGELATPETWESAARELASLDEASPERARRHRRILAGEMSVAADLQVTLVDAGVVDSALATDLERRLDADDPSRRAEIHAEIIEEHLGVTLPLAVS